MEKDDAILFIIRQYSMGYAREEIARQLSQQLGAPQAVVTKFVDQTIDQNFPNLPLEPMPAPPPIQEPVSPPQDFSPASFYTSAERETGLEEASAWQAGEADGFIDLDLPGFSAPGKAPYQDNQDAYTYGDSSRAWGEAEADNDYGTYAAGAQDSAEPGYAQGPGGYEAQQASWMPGTSAGLSEASLYDPTYNLGPAASAQAPAPATSPSASMEDDPEVVNLVIKALGKNTKQSDVIVAVCEQYGLDYKDAQRLVARIHAKNRKAVSSRQNMLIIPMCVLAMLGGLALLVMGILEAFDLRSTYLHASSGTDAVVLSQSSYFVRRIVPQALFGIGLLVGGLFGLVKSIRSQTE